MKIKISKSLLSLLVMLGSISLTLGQSPTGLDIPIPDPPIDLKKIAAERTAKEEAAKKAAEEKARANAPEAPKPEKVAEVSTSHTIEAGGSLSLISAKVYARPGYWRILKLHNGVAPEKLQAGQEIKAPDLKWLLADSDFTWKYPQVSKDLMAARKMFMEVENKLEASIEKDTISPDDEDRKKIKEAIALINKSRTTLMEKRKGVKKTPSAAILQLRTASQTMALISSGTKRAAVTQNLVHEHLSNSIVYAVLWARAGFK